MIENTQSYRYLRDSTCIYYNSYEMYFRHEWRLPNGRWRSFLMPRDGYRYWYSRTPDGWRCVDWIL